MHLLHFMTRSLVAFTVAAVITVPLTVQAQQPAVVGADEVILEPFHQTALAIGRFVPLFESIVPSLLQSHVTRISVNVGDRLDAGQEIARLDIERLGWRVRQSEALVRQREATVNAAQAQAEAAARRLARAEGLRESTAFSESQRDDARGEAETTTAQVHVAEAALEEAKALLDLSKNDYRHGIIHAPFAGVVEERHADLGEAVQMGSPIVTLVSDSDLEIEVEVPSLKARVLAAGTEMLITLADKTSRQAHVRSVGSVENPRTRTRRVRLVPVLPPEMPLPAVGESTEVHVPIGGDTAVPTVSKDAVIQNQGLSLVYVIADGVAQIRPVQLGDAVGDRFVVYEGVGPGEMVVVRGNERILPGQSVMVAPPSVPSGSPSQQEGSPPDEQQGAETMQGQEEQAQ